MHWEFQNSQEMLVNLVGFHYGETPEKELPYIIEDREKVAYLMYKKMFLNPEDCGLEIGSGCGHLSKPIANKVSFLHCADVSQSFLDSAKEYCSDLNNLSFNKITTGDLSFIKDGSLDFAFAHAVFIHFNLYDIYLYLKELHKKLKPTGRVCFDFLCSDDLSFSTNQHFLNHVNEYQQVPSDYPMLLKYHSEKTILKMARDLGFEVHSKWRGPNCDLEILLIKSDSPAATQLKARLSSSVGVLRWVFNKTYAFLVKVKICPVFNRKEKLRRWGLLNTIK